MTRLLPHMRFPSLFALLLLVGGCGRPSAPAPVHPVLKLDAGELTPETLMRASVTELGLNADGSLLAAATRDSVYLLELPGGSERFRAKAPPTVYGIGVSADGGTLAAGSGHTIWVWDLDAPEATAQRLQYAAIVGESAGGAGAGTTFDLSPDGRYGVTATPGTKGQPRIVLWDIEDRRIATSLAEGPAGSGRPSAQAAAFSPSGERIAVVLRPENVLQLRSVPTGELLEAIDLGGSVAVVQELSWSADGERIAVVGAGFDDERGWYPQPVRVRNLAADQWDSELPVAGFTNTAAFVSDRHLATGSSEGAVEIWDTRTGTRVRSLSAAAAGVSAVAAAPRIPLLISAGSDQTGPLQLWTTAPTR